LTLNIAALFFYGKKWTMSANKTLAYLESWVKFT